MASNKQLCGVCDQRHIATIADDWCPECEEALCSTCKEHHSLSKASRSHKTIPIDNYSKLPPFILGIKQYCEKHNDKYQLLCKKHDSPLCAKCVTDHVGCTDIVHLNDIIQDRNSLEIIHDAKQSLSDLQENFVAVRQNREDNIKEINQQKQTCLDEVRKLRRKINTHLDKIEDQMVKQINDIEKSTTVKINEILEVITNEQEEVKQLKEMVENITTHASELQVFYGIREIESLIKKKENSLQSLFDEKRCDRIELNYTINSKIKDILNEVEYYGTIAAKTYQSRVKIKRSKDKQAQRLLPKAKRSLSDLKVTLQQRINTDCRIGRGCSVTEDGKLLFTNRELNSVIIFDCNGRHMDDIYTYISNSSVFDLTNIGNNKIAVSSGGSEKKCVDIIDLKTREIENSISLPGCVYGICYHDNSLYCCVEKKNIHVISLSDSSVTEIDNTPTRGYSYVAVNDGKILYSDREKHSVFCCLLDGTVVWEFNDESILKLPRGISVDGASNVYVVGKISANIVVISPDGKNHRVILSHEDDLTEPISLHYNKDNDTLLVVNRNKTSNIYNILKFNFP